MHSRSLAFLRDLEENLQRGQSETSKIERREPSGVAASSEAQAPQAVAAPPTSIRTRLAKLFTKTRRQGTDANEIDTDADFTNGDLSPTRLRRAPATVTLGNGLMDTSIGVQLVAVPVAPLTRGAMSNSFSAPRTLNRTPSLTAAQPAGTGNSSGAALVPTLRHASTSRGVGARASVDAQRSTSRYALDRTASITYPDPGSPVPAPATSVTTPGHLPELSPPSQTQPRSAAARRASTGTAAWATVLGAATASQPGTSATESPTCCSPISAPFPPGLDSPRGPGAGVIRTLRLSTKQANFSDEFDTPAAAALLSELSSPFNTDEVVHVPSQPPTVVYATPPATAPAAATPNSRRRLCGRPGSVRAASTGSAGSYYLPPGVTVAPADDDNSDVSGDVLYPVDVAATATAAASGSAQRRLKVALSGASFSSRREPLPPHHYQQQQQQAQLQVLLLQPPGHGNPLEPSRPARNHPLPLRSTSFVGPKAALSGASSPVAFYGSGGGGAGSPVAYGGGGGGGRGGNGLAGSMRRMLGHNDSMRRQLVRQGSMTQCLVGVGGGEGEEGEGEELAEGGCQPMMSPRALRARGRSAVFLGGVMQ